MNNELRKNAEGYTDPTAAATLNKREPGDIWAYKGQECLIIKGHTGFATILRLHDDNKYGDRIKVVDWEDGPRYVDPAFVITGRYQEMNRYIETLDVDTFTQVIRAVEDAVGLSLMTTVDVNTVPRKETVDTQEADKLREEVAQLQEQLAAAINTATKARNQLELLRDMYNELLAKTLGEA